MKQNIKYSVAAAILTGLLSGCMDGEDTRAGGNADKVEPLTTDTPVLEITVTESDAVMELDLFAGINNPSGTEMFVFNMSKPNLWPDGTPDFDNSAESIKQPLVPRSISSGTPGEDDYVAYEVFQGGFEQTGNILKIQPHLWQDELAYQETSEFKLFYEVDNGYDNGDDDFDNDRLLRQINVTIVGTEDPVEEIVFVDGATAEVPQDSSDVQLAVNILPANASLQELVWESSDPSIASVVTFPEGDTLRHKPFVTAAAYAEGETGNKEVTITARPKEGVNKDTVVSSIKVVITEFPNHPTGVQVSIEGVEDSAADTFSVTHGMPLQLEAEVLPLEASFDDMTVRWESTDPTIATVDDNGLVKLVNPDKGPVIIKAIANDNDRTQQITITPAQNPNYVYKYNGLFESGQLAPWVFMWGGNGSISVTEDAAKDGNYGAHLEKTTGSSNTGFVLKPSETDLMLPENFGQGGLDRSWKFTFDILVANTTGNFDMFIHFVPNNQDGNTSARRWFGVNGGVTDGQWHTLTNTIPEPDWSGMGALSVATKFYMTGAAEGNYYFDNFTLECVGNDC